MNEKNRPDVSRRDFVKTTAVGFGGLGALSAAGISTVEAAQAGERAAAQAGTTHLDKLTITVSPSGGGGANAGRTVQQHADACVEGYNAGAAIVHIRGGRVKVPPGTLQGNTGPDLDNWRQITDLVKAKCPIVINYGNSAMYPPIRKPLLTLRPEGGSFLVGHHYGGTTVLLPDQKQSAIDHAEYGVMPEVELFHTGDVANLNVLIKTGLLKPPYCVTVFLEYETYYPVPANLMQLDAMVAQLPPEAHWTVCVKGPNHLKMAAYAIARGGHVRTGLENGVELAPGRPAKTQGECVERIVKLAQDLGRPVATPQEARQMLALPRKPEKLTAA